MGSAVASTIATGLLYPGAGWDLTAPWLPGVTTVLCIDRLPAEKLHSADSAATAFQETFYETIDEQMRRMGLAPLNDRTAACWEWAGDSRKLTYVHSTRVEALNEESYKALASCNQLYICGWLPRTDGDRRTLSKLHVEHIYLAATTGWQVESLRDLQACVGGDGVTFHLVDNCASRQPREFAYVTHDRYGVEYASPVPVDAMGPYAIVASARHGVDDLHVLLQARVRCMAAGMGRAPR